MKMLRMLIIVLALGIQACTFARTHPNPHGDKSVSVTENRKYGLKCIFHAEKLEGFTVINSISLQDSRTNHEAEFKPIDRDSLIPGKGFFKDVWSPDEEYLILPLGRWDGFCIVQSRDALQSVEAGRWNDFVRVEMNNGTGLWHEFGKWREGNSFEFSAGLSGDQIPFVYDILTRRLTALDPITDSFVGQNASGKVAISKSE